jgi:hypothetical protein
MSHNTRANSYNFHRVSHPIGRLVFFSIRLIQLQGHVEVTPCYPPAGLVRRKWSAVGDAYTGQSQTTAQIISVSWLAFRISEVLGSNFVHYTFGLDCDVWFSLFHPEKYGASTSNRPRSFPVPFRFVHQASCIGRCRLRLTMKRESVWSPWEDKCEFVYNLQFQSYMVSHY